jgi:hypothetical protein
MKSEEIWKCEPPADDEAETSISPEQIQEALNSLVEKGLVVPTGELRRGRDGKLYPVYVHYDYAEQYTTASAILEKKRRHLC